MPTILQGKKLEKARLFWTRINALRRSFGHCNRCGRPWIGKTQQCDHCREYHKQYKPVKIEKLKRGQWKAAMAMIEPLTKRVASLEIAVARFQLQGRDAYQRGWRMGFRKGANHRADNYDALRGKYDGFKAGCKTSKEELKQISHAYR